MRWAWLLLLLVGCGSTGHVMSANTRRIVMASTTAVAFRVHIKDLGARFPRADGEKMLAYGAAVISKPIPLTSSQLDRLRGLIDEVDRDAKLNESVNAKDCMPNPGVAVRFKCDQGRVDVLICLECLELAFANVGASETENWGNFDTKKAEMLAIAKELFPRDAAIQELR